MSSKACSDLCFETSKVTSMAQNPKGLKTVFFQVRTTNKMNETFGTLTSTNYYKDVEKGYPVL